MSLSPSAAFKRARGRVSWARIPHVATASSGHDGTELNRQNQALQRIEQLRHRHEELARLIAQEHWDLGGLTYEMAARDHFRLDVLVGRAATLQEHDMELAEVARQLNGLAGADAAADATAAGGPKHKATPGRILGAMLPVFIGFGMLVGQASNGAGARRPEPLKLLLGAQTAASSPAVAAAAGGTEGSANEAESAGEASSSAGSGASRSAAGSKTQRTGKSSSKTTEAGASAPASASGPVTKLPPIRHVFVIMLSDEPYGSVFAPESKVSYILHRLEPKGTLLSRFYAVAHEALAGEIALISGQGPTLQTAANCPTYTAIAPTSIGADGQVLGEGCVYPSSTATIASQLAAKNMRWRAYVEGIGGGSTGAQGACARPTIGAADPSASPTSTSLYATYLDPFLYFNSLTGSATCAGDVVSIEHLAGDLHSEASTPSFSYIIPDRCHDAAPEPCAPGQPAGPAAANAFLESVVPKILAANAFRKNGLLIISTNQAPGSGEFADSTGCCGQPKFPNLPAASTSGPGGLARGGGQVGALLLSPFIKGGTIESEHPYNTFSLLRTIEDMFSLPHLGYAALPGVSSLEPAIFTIPAPGT